MFVDKGDALLELHIGFTDDCRWRNALCWRGRYARGLCVRIGLEHGDNDLKKRDNVIHCPSRGIAEMITGSGAQRRR